MRTIGVMCMVGLALAGAGCCTERACAPRNREPMTVETAMQQVADGLNAFSAMSLDKRSGLMPDEVTVVLNITEARSSSGGGQAGVADGPAKLMVDFSHQRAETRGNQITLKFQNVLLAEKNTIAGSRTPEEIAALVQGLTNSNFMLKSVVPPR